MQEKWWQQVLSVIKKRWLLILIIVVVLVIIAVPGGYVLSMNSSVYDCGFPYTKCDDPLKEIAKKHVYYNANDKTVEIELSQDLINSLIKDYVLTQDLGLPKNISVGEATFNTKDQRIYINAKYGKLNTPISAKININITNGGLEISASDIRLGKKKAPGFVKKQLPAEILNYSLKYEDFGIPYVFDVKEIKFGSGVVDATIQIDADKVSEFALDYYKKNVESEVDKLKNNQSGLIGTFVNKVLGTGMMSDDKVKEYVVKALGNEELMNSALYFATADDLTKYTNTFEDVEQKVTDWAAPLQAIKYYGSIDATVDTILADDKLRDLLTWFLPQEDINEYVNTVEEYYSLYKDYYGMYEDAMASLDSTLNGIDTKKMDESVKSILDYAAQVKETRDYLIEQLNLVDTNKVEQLIAYLESDKSVGEDFIDSMGSDNYNSVKDYLADATGTKSYWLDQLEGANMNLVDDFSSVLTNREKFVLSLITQLKNQEYEQAINKVTGEGIVDKKTKTFMDDLNKQIDTTSAIVNDYTK